MARYDAMNYNNDLKKYSTNRANQNIALTDTGTGSNKYNNGDTIEVMDFSTDVVYDENFVGPIPNGINNANNDNNLSIELKKSQEQVNIESELARVNEYAKTLKNDVDYYNAAVGAIDDDELYEDPAKYKEKLDKKVQEATGFKTYEEFLTYKNNVTYSYQIKISNREFLPNCSNDPQMVALDNEIALYQNLLNISSQSVDELKGYYDQIPSTMLGMYEQSKYQSSPNYVGYGPSMQAAQGNIGIYTEQINNKIFEITNGKYSSFEQFKRDYNSAVASNNECKNILDGLKNAKTKQVYSVIAKADDYINYNSKNIGENISSSARERLTELGELSKINEYEEYIKSMLPEEARNDVKFDFDYYKMYAFLIDTYGEDVANQYLSDVDDEIKCLEGLIEASEFCKLLNEDSGDVNADIGNLLPVHFKGIGDGTINSVEGLLAWLSENPEKSAKYYESLWIAQFLATGKYGKIQGFNYEVGQSLGNMLPSVALSAVNPYLGSIYLGLSSGGNTYRNLRWKGVDLSTARFKGLLSGASEVLTERWLGALPFLSEVKVTNVKTWLMSMVREGNQEVLQDLFNSMLMGEEYTLEEAIKTWLIAGITSGEMNLPGLVGSSINRNNVREDNGWLRMPSENGEVAINVDYLTDFMEKNPNAKYSDLEKIILSMTEMSKTVDSTNLSQNVEVDSSRNGIFLNEDFLNNLFALPEVGAFGVPLENFLSKYRGRSLTIEEVNYIKEQVPQIVHADINIDGLIIANEGDITVDNAPINSDIITNNDNPLSIDFDISSLDNPVEYFINYAKENSVDYYDVLNFTGREDISQTTKSLIVSALLTNNLELRNQAYNNAIDQVKVFMNNLGCTDDNVINRAFLALFGTRESFMSNDTKIFNGESGVVTYNWNEFVDIISPYMESQIMAKAKNQDAILWSNLKTEFLNEQFTTIENCTFGDSFHALDLIFPNWNSDATGTPKLLDLWQSLSKKYAEVCCNIVDSNGVKNASIRLLVDEKTTLGECFAKSELPTILADGSINNIIVENVELQGDTYVTLKQTKVNIQELSMAYKDIISKGFSTEISAQICFEKFKQYALGKKIFEMTPQEIINLVKFEIGTKLDFNNPNWRQNLDMIKQKAPMLVELSKLLNGTNTNGSATSSIDLLSVSDRQLVRQAAMEIYDRANDNEPYVTELMKKLVDSSTDLVGLEYRMKSIDSIVDKIARKVYEKQTIDYAKNNINDSLRYTLLVSENYERTVLNKLKMLSDNGFKVVDMRNAWGDHTYQGLNITLKGLDGVLVELQFHTPGSFYAKQVANHELYELSRNTSTSSEIRLLSNKIQALNQQIYVGNDTTFKYYDIISLNEAINKITPFSLLYDGAKKYGMNSLLAQKGMSDFYGDAGLEVTKMLRDQHKTITEILSELQGPKKEQFLYFLNNTIEGKYLSSLTDAELSAITRYTGGDYAMINTWLRENNIPEYEKVYIDTLNSALAKFGGTKGDTQLYRGIDVASFTGQEVYKNIFNGIDTSDINQIYAALKGIEGEVFTDAGYMSTSPSYQHSFASWPSKNIVLDIIAPDGTPGAYINQISKFYNSENEFLLAAGTKLKMVSIEAPTVIDGNEKIIIKCEVIK